MSLPRIAASLRPLARRGPATAARLLPRLQRRSAQVINNARFFQTAVEPRVVAKYREKLEEKLRSEGVSTIEELKEVYKDKIKAIRSEAAVPGIDAVLNATPAARIPPPFTPPPAPSPIADAAKSLSSPKGVKSLASYVDPDKLAAHTDHKEIEMIWRARFVADDTSLCAVMPSATYTRMATAAKKFPMFVLPLPRDGQGVEMHLLQWTFPTELSSTVIFTSLEDYKLRGEFAQPHTTLTHHLELADEKELVLAQGQVLPERGVTVAQAQFLVIALQKFYGAFEGPDSLRRREMLEMFARGDQGFSIDAVIKEVEMAE